MPPRWESPPIIKYYNKIQSSKRLLSPVEHARPPQSSIQSPQSSIPSPQSSIQSPQSSIQSPQSSIQSPPTQETAPSSHHITESDLFNLKSVPDDYLVRLIPLVHKFLENMEELRSGSPPSVSIEILQIVPTTKCDVVITYISFAKHVPFVSDALSMLNAIELYIDKLLEKLISSTRNQICNGKNTKNWKSVKEYLLKLSKWLDEVLFHYKYNQDDELPQVNDLRQCTKDILKVLNKMGTAKVKRHLGQGTQVSYHEIIASTIGLKPSIGKEVENAQNSFPGHQDDVYYFKKFIDENLRNEFEKSNTDTVIVLEKAGFTYSKASAIHEHLKKNDLEGHQSLEYWVEHYLDYTFKYDLFLNDSCPTFPRKEGNTKEWFTESIEVKDGDDIRSFDVELRNVPLDKIKSFAEDDNKFPLTKKGNDYWYHGTDHKAAEDIRLNEIRLGAGKCKQDFSDGGGFYLTPHFDTALSWASKRAIGKSKGAVLIYQCSIDEFKHGINLFERPEEWTEIVKKNRTGQSNKLNKRVKKASYILGQMSGEDGSPNTDGATWRDPEWQPKKKEGNNSQLCIKCSDMAEQFSYALKGIIFFA